VIKSFIDRILGQPVPVPGDRVGPIGLDANFG